MSSVNTSAAEMDAIRKRASAFRDSVAKQQQAVFKSFSSHGSGDQLIIDEAELQRHHQLERLYTSTKIAKHFQREIVRGVEGIISTGVKQYEVANKLADDCRKYATEGPSSSGVLAKASFHFGSARKQMENERDNMHRFIGTQVAEPLRSMVMGAPLEDARLLTQRYERLRQEAENQALDVGRKQVRSKEGNPDADQKLQLAEQKMGELLSAMAVLGKEAAAAMTSVEAQQQRQTLQRLMSMVEAERAYHLRAAEILEQLQGQMASERQRNETNAPSTGDSYAPPSYDDVKVNDASQHESGSKPSKSLYFLAEVMYPFEPEEGGELGLQVGDYVVVRQVSSTGWSEGETRGRAGWFPSSHVEKRQRIPASKVVDVGLQVA
ncbi:SH3 domain-containing protein 2 isoform X2 [Physcomitrium patens]|uniref:SH3 domain-containing protein n=1 Tax=Physcomitrium patens TaxID=3218 RepID=A0A7I4D2W9_PHYPA|nr:SH3 domain-containing protein 2-like isoform X1 [Physcomitrium patens]|eukprot:XP_024369211.1 SH3 domain-containing protein 2-like isoform X1 [Physcomitrella patens]